MRAEAETEGPERTREAVRRTPASARRPVWPIGAGCVMLAAEPYGAGPMAVKPSVETAAWAN
jgi:hypothetical protein